MGVYPRVFLDRSKASVEAVTQRVGTPQSGGSFEAILQQQQKSDH